MTVGLTASCAVELAASAGVDSERGTAMTPVTHAALFAPGFRLCRISAPWMVRLQRFSFAYTWWAERCFPRDSDVF